MPTLTPEAIYQICLDVGFSPDEAVTFTAIALAESGGNTHAHNPSGEDSWGLWQVNIDPDVRPNTWGDLTDPRNNARAAFEISRGGSDMSPWTVTHDRNRGTARDYRNFLDEASAASGGAYHGDNRGVTGYGGGPGEPGGFADGGATVEGGVGLDDVDGGAGAGVQAFLDAALAQAGDPYVWASEADLGDADPDAFDCSELVQWAAGRVGVEMPDGSWLQYLELQEQGAVIPVEEALRTPGAILFSFSSEPTPGGGRPSSAHVAISLGDGTTIEARGTRYGVGTFDAGDRFAYAAVIPGLGGAAPVDGGVVAPPVDDDLDDDLLADYDELSHGTDPSIADTDLDGLLDGFEVALGTSPTAMDSDLDGLSDAYEMSRSRTNPLAADTDADSVSDNLEVAAGTDAVEGVRFTLGSTAAAGTFGLGAEVDTDADGLADSREAALGSDAAVADSDRDGVADGLEYSAGTNLLRADSDSDGLSDAFELSLGTDPTRADTDNDGIFDGAELAAGSDPLVSAFAGGGPGTALAAPPAPTAPAPVVPEYEPVVGVADQPPVPAGPAAGPAGAPAPPPPDDDSDDDDAFDGFM